LKNIVSTKKNNAIFLAIVLVAGTIVLSSPSFMIGNVQAQRDYGMDSYEPKPYGNSYDSDYGKDSYDKKPYGNSYERDYVMDNSYDKKPYGNSYERDYVMDNSYDKKPYGNSYERDYVMDNDKKPQIFPANKVAELGDRWWQWIASLNVEENPNPFTETGQAGCDVGLQDNGRLLFLVGSPRNETTGEFPIHECEIQKDVSILFPIVNVICDNLEAPPFFGANETAQRICANNLADTAFDLHANIDGFEVKNPEQYRVDSPAGGFTLTAVGNNTVGIPAGTGTAVQDGFWILLKPLKPGEHIISFSGAFDFTQVPGIGSIIEAGATYILDIQPSEKSYYPDDYHQQNYQMN
jgi:hypothetical protein